MDRSWPPVATITTPWLIGSSCPATFSALLKSHILPAGPDSPFLRDDFDAFLNWREDHLAHAIEEATGVSVEAQPSAPAPAGRGTNDTIMASTGPTFPIPTDIAALIARRASTWTKPLAEAFAREALACPGVELRLQISRAEPWYFQVRHPSARAVVAYVHPRTKEVHIEYLLRSNHDLYGVAQRRDESSYGLVMKVRQSADLSIALRLLGDALDAQE